MAGCLLLMQPAVAQQMKREEIIAAFVFNFAQNIEWRTEARIPEFRVQVLSNDRALNREMTKLSEAAKLKGKPIKVSVSKAFTPAGNPHLIYIARGMKHLAAPVFRSIEGRNILLVTEGCEDKRIVMINLIETKDATMKFEINKANILNQGLKILPDMVLLGGTEIDVAKLYKESQDTLRIKEDRIMSLRRHLDSIEAKIAVARAEIEGQNLQIAGQNLDIQKQKQQLELQRAQLEEQRLQSQRRRDTLSQLAGMLRTSQSVLSRQEKEIEAGKAVLSLQQHRIDSQNAAIREQTKVLEQQDLTIADQKDTQRFLTLGIILVLGFSYAIYRSYVGKREAHRRLEEQQVKLQEMLVQLQIARDKAQLYLDIAEVFLVAVGADRTITLINRKGCEILGRPVEEVLGKDWFETCVPASIRGEILATFGRIVAGAMGPAGYIEHLVSTRGMGERLIAWHFVIMRDGEGTITGALGSGEDITEKRAIERRIKNLNRELRERAAALEAANKELEAFSYSVSHDLRAPLRSIDGFSQAILEDYQDGVDDRGKDYLRRVRAAAQRMAQLIDDMLDLSRVTRNEMVMRDVDLSGMAEDIAGRLRRQQPERRAEFIIEPAISAWGDEHLLRIALDNLFDNAWKYTSKHPSARIEFGARTVDGKRACFVKDDGAGFEMQYAQKLFGAFQRLHTSAEFPGTGVGLATVQRIIHRHGGRIWAQSEVEKGAVFYFTLPGKESEDGGA